MACSLSWQSSLIISTEYNQVNPLDRSLFLDRVRDLETLLIFRQKNVIFTTFITFTFKIRNTFDINWVKNQTHIGFHMAGLINSMMYLVETFIFNNIKCQKSQSKQTILGGDLFKRFN